MFFSRYIVLRFNSRLASSYGTSYCLPICGLDLDIGPNLLLIFSGANILRGVAGAGVLAGFDKFKEVYMKWRFA